MAQAAQAARVARKSYGIAGGPPGQGAPDGDGAGPIGEARAQGRHRPNMAPEILLVSNNRPGLRSREGAIVPRRQGERRASTGSARTGSAPRSPRAKSRGGPRQARPERAGAGARLL